MVRLLAILVNYSKAPKIDGWQVVIIAGILFAAVTFYGTFIFSRSLSFSVDEGGITAKTSGSMPDGSG